MRLRFNDSDHDKRNTFRAKLLNATKGIQKRLTPNHPAHSTVAFVNYEIYWEATLATPAHLWSCFCGQLGQRRFSWTKWAMDSMCSLATAKAYMEHESLEVTLEAVEIRKCLTNQQKEQWSLTNFRFSSISYAAKHWLGHLDPVFSRSHEFVTCRVTSQKLLTMNCTLM